MSSTQQLILLTEFIIRPVSSDQTDFIRDSNKMSKGNYNCSFIHEVIVQKHVPGKGVKSKTPTKITRRI